MEEIVDQSLNPHAPQPAYEEPYYPYASTSQEILPFHDTSDKMDIDPSLLVPSTSMAANFSISPQEIQQQQNAKNLRQRNLSATGINSNAGPVASTSQILPKDLPPIPVNDKEERAAWARVEPTLKELIEGTRFSKSPSAAAKKLSDLISAFNVSKSTSKWSDGSNVPPEGRKMVLDAMLKLGRAAFWKAWLTADIMEGMDTLEKWLIGCAKDAAEGTLASRLIITRLPILKVLDELDLTKVMFKGRKIGKAVVKLSTMEGAKNCRPLAEELIQKWNNLPDLNETEPAPKRKAESTAPAAAKKKAKVDVPKPLPAAPAPFSGVPPVKFPTFKRAAPAAPVQTAFQKAMSSMAGNTPAPQNPVPVPVIAPVVALPAPKKKKTVRFKDDAELEQVRIIERAIYDDDAKDESGERITHSVQEAKEMDEQEGLTLSHMANLMVEEVEWYTPAGIIFPLTDDFDGYHNIGAESVEVTTQTAREAMTAAFDDSQELPDSASEPVELAPSTNVTKAMILPPELSTPAMQARIDAAQAKSRDEVEMSNQPDLSQLLNQLNPNVLRDSYGARADASNRWNQPSGSNYDQSTEFRQSKKDIKAGRTSQRSKASSKICKFFGTRTGCDWGDNCSFVHDRS